MTCSVSSCKFSALAPWPLVTSMSFIPAHPCLTCTGEARTGTAFQMYPMSEATREGEGWFPAPTGCTHRAQGDVGFPCSKGSIFHEDHSHHSFVLFVLFCVDFLFCFVFCSFGFVLVSQSIFLAFYQIFIPAQVNWNCTELWWVFHMKRLKTFRKLSSLSRTDRERVHFYLLLQQMDVSYWIFLVL